MANHMAAAAAIRQTINSAGYAQIKAIGDALVAGLKNDLVEAESDFEGRQREARGAIRFYNKFMAAVENAATTQIEAETEIQSIV